MILERFYDKTLAQASYIVGCAATGEAIVIDPNRDIDTYLEFAASEGLRIVAVTETHIHADYLSGSLELADRTGAKLFVSDEGDSEWKYAFANRPNVVLVKDGDNIRVGNISLEVVHTPGHTPEHIALVLTDHPASSEPLGAFTGDFMFVGDVGRPDLLERAAGFEGTMEKGAATLFDSLQRFRSRFQAQLLIWPAHGAGSACGKSLGGVPVSTLGYEESSNWALRESDKSHFIREVLEGQPEPPVYFKEMKRMNKLGPAMRHGLPQPVRMAGSSIHEVLARKSGTVLDVRPVGEAAMEFIPGALNIPLGRDLTNWAGWLIPYGPPISLIAPDQHSANEAARLLSLIGLDSVDGWMGPDCIREFGSPIQLEQIDVKDSAAGHEAGKLQLVDVRSRREFAESHVPDVKHIPLGELRSRSHELSRELPIVVHCASGVRSPMAVSLLKGLGFDQVANMTLGFDEYLNLGLPIEVGATPQQVEASAT